MFEPVEASICRLLFTLGRRILYRNMHGHGCAPARFAFNAECAAEQFRPLSQVHHAQTAALVVVRINCTGIEAHAVVRNLYDNHIFLLSGLR